MRVWIEHTGTECPVSPDTVVRVYSARKDIYVTARAEEIRWENVGEYQIIQNLRVKNKGDS